MQGVRAYIHYKIEEIRDFELMCTYQTMCTDRKLKEDHKHLEVKQLTCALDFLKVFRNEWICIALIQVYDGKIWLDGPK